MDRLLDNRKYKKKHAKKVLEVIDRVVVNREDTPGSMARSYRRWKEATGYPRRATRPVNVYHGHYFHEWKRI